MPVFVGASGFALVFELVDQDGVALPTDGATFPLKILSPAGAITNKTCDVLPGGPANLVGYTMESGVLSAAGLWQLQLTYSRSGISVPADIQLLRVREALEAPAP